MHVNGSTKAYADAAVSFYPQSTQSRFSIDGKFLARGGKRVRLRGVTYGPFRPREDLAPFPALNTARRDFRLMADADINAIRTYHVPPQRMLDCLCNQGQLAVLVDVPWSKHTCFLDSARARAEARQAVREAAVACRYYPCVIGYSIGNEIAPDVVRWHGAKRVQAFLAELADLAKQTDPACLTTYGNYPPTEYLELGFLDFATFNVYLHDRETFHRYLFRLQNLVGTKPLVLGELGMDTLRHGELSQAEFLSGHVAEAMQTGLAGAFVFAWTDEWFTGEHAIQDWRFGITHADRRPKAAYYALQEMFEADEALEPSQKPKVSVVVCSYNGGRTLAECLKSLSQLNYPNYEVILVDDGSTDDTRAIVEQFPWVRAIHTKNDGLSTARNVGLKAATGSVVAYTDSDCFADRDWLTHLMQQLEASGAGAVGGPNFTPEDGRVAACVAAAPGQPTHVLESDQVAEHIPGCNMAFRKDVLVSINGFDPQFRKAGDDVDVCWRLQQAGHWITFAPAAFVWHHRRQTSRAYLKQQAGYGEAEALLRFKHPDKFNGRGAGKWRGVLYGNSLQGLVLGDDVIYRGTFSTGLFQCIYQAGPAHWAMLPTTLEWQAAALIVLLTALYWAPAAAAGLGMFALSVTVVVMQAAQAQLAARHDGLGSRTLVALLCYLQPIVRAWARYKTRYFGAHTSGNGLERYRAKEFSLLPLTHSEYWGADHQERVTLLNSAVARLAEGHCGMTVDTGFMGCDLKIFCGPWSTVEVRTVQEDHGSGHRLLRVQHRLRLSPPARYAALVGVAMTSAAAFSDARAAVASGLALAGALALTWYRGGRLRSRVVGLLDSAAAAMGLSKCDPQLVLPERATIEGTPDTSLAMKHRSRHKDHQACPLAD